MAENYGASTSALTPDGLIAGAAQLVTEEITLLSGVGALTRGALLGKVTCGAITPVTSGTGNGTGGSTSLGIYCQPGDYVAKCIEATTNYALFNVNAPDGKSLGVAATGVAFTSNEINFTIADGGTDFVVGDTVTFTVAAGSGKYKLFNIAGVVGEAKPVGILAVAADSTSADVDTIAYVAGEFSEDWVSDNSSTNYSGLTTAQKLIVKNQLRDLNIYFKDTTRTA